METNEPNLHHVAWADRLGLNKIWHEAIQACSNSYGTEDYRRNVFRLYHLLVDIKDGPKLKARATRFKNTIWEQEIQKRLTKWKKSNPDLQEELDVIQDEEEKIREDLMEMFFDYILQLLETEGYGFYNSDLSVDEISLTNKSEYITEGDEPPDMNF